MLEAVLLAILLTVVIVTIAMAVLVGVFSFQLSRSNRVSPDTATTAPVVWLWSPTQAAKLHRRLRGAVRPLAIPSGGRGRRGRRGGRGRRRSAQPPPHAELRQTVAAQAVAIDHHVVYASRLSRQTRRRQLHALAPQVAEIERLSLRLVHQQRLAGQPANIGGPHPVAPSPAEVLHDVEDRLDRLDEAHQELLAIERDNGLDDPDEVLNRIATPPPVPGTRVIAPPPVSATHVPASPPATPEPRRRPSPS